MMSKAEMEMNRCVYSMKYGTHDEAKKHYDKAWKAMVEEGCSKETENGIRFMQENFYPEIRKGPGMTCTAYGEHMENKILARQENDWD